MAEIIDEVAVITSDLTSGRNLIAIDEVAVLGDSIQDTVIAVIAETAVITDILGPPITYALIAEQAVIEDTPSAASLYTRVYNETARVSDALTGFSVVSGNIEETAVITGGMIPYVPTEIIAEHGVLGDSVSAVRWATATITEQANVSGGPLALVFATTEETAVVGDSVSVVQHYASRVDEVAVITSDLTAINLAYALTNELAVVGDSLSSAITTTAVYAEQAYISGDPAYMGGAAWTANATNFATSQYKDHPLEQIVGDFGLSKDGVFIRGAEVFDFELRTSLDDFGDASGKRCTYVAAGCSPASEFLVDMMAADPDGTTKFYPVNVWPRATGRFFREFNAPRGVLSQTFGVRIRGSAPDAFELTSLVLAPLASGRR